MAIDPAAAKNNLPNFHPFHQAKAVKPKESSFSSVLKDIIKLTPENLKTSLKNEKK